MSTRSKASIVTSTMRWTWSWCSTSVGTNCAAAPSSSCSSRATALPVSWLISAIVTAAPSRAKARATPRPIPCPAPVTIAALPSSLGMALIGAAEDQRAGRPAGAGSHAHVLDPVDQLHRRGGDLADGVGDAVHAVDVCLAQLAAVHVDRKPATELDVAVPEELLGLAARTEPELLELREHQRREVVVDDRGLDVVGAQTSRVPQLTSGEAHLGQPRDRVPVVARHHVLLVAGALGRGVDDRRW